MTAVHMNREDELRYDWSVDEIMSLYALPFNDLLFKAQTIHRENFDPNAVQVSTLLSIKTGACPEDCKYCSQSGHHQTDLEKEKLLQISTVVAAAKKASQDGASRFCMGAAWRCPRDQDMSAVIEMVQEVKKLGMETCMTLGMLSKTQAERLADAGLDYYNHNLDTSEDYYPQIVTTRTYQDRIETLGHVRDAGMKTCAGGILGMGESRSDRAGLLMQLANLPRHPDSVPINMLIPIPGTPLENEGHLDPFEFVRTVAIARILMPASYVRLSAGRESMNDQTQSLCFLAGANSIFMGDKLLTTKNKAMTQDNTLFERLGIGFIEANVETIVDDRTRRSSSLYYDALEA